MELRNAESQYLYAILWASVDVDKMMRDDDDNPTLGIVLCSETDEDIAEFWLNDEKNIFMSKYMLMLPSKLELKQEIEQQKALFALQQGSIKDSENL